METVLIFAGFIAALLFTMSKAFAMQPPKHHLPLGAYDPPNCSKFYWGRDFCGFTWYPVCLFCDHRFECHFGAELECPNDHVN